MYAMWPLIQIHMHTVQQRQPLTMVATHVRIWITREEYMQHSMQG